MNSAIESATQKAVWRLLPFVILMYFIAFLDRVNIGFAALTMNADLGISPSQFGFAAGVFFVGYAFFEVPSSLLGQKFGIPNWTGRIMITWGLASIATVFVTSVTMLYGLRFVLGVAEAGFFPGILVYMTMWFPSAQRGRIFGLLQAAAPISGIVGAPLSAVILTQMNGAGGMAGWRWLFLLEGLPAVILGIACFWYMTPRPRDAAWLTPQERDALEAQLELERRHKEVHGHHTLLAGLTNPRVLLLAALFFFVILGMNGVSFWTPQIIGSFGFTTMQVGLLTAVPSICGAVAMLLWSRHSDRTQERVWHLILPMLLSSAGFFAASATLSYPTAALVALTIATTGLWCTISVYWTWPTSTLTGMAAAAGVALINSTAQLSGLVGPWAIGWSKELTGGFGTAMAGFGIGFLLAATMAFLWSRGATSLYRHEQPA